MWSKNPMPVLTLASPRPSRSTRTRRSVSLVFRLTSPIRGMSNIKSVGGKNLLQCRHDFIHVFGCANRDPETFRQLGRRRYISDQDAVLLIELEEELLGGHRTATDQDKICGARIDDQTRQLPQPVDEPVSGGNDLGRPIGEQRSVPQGGTRRSQGNQIHIIGELPFGDLARHGWMRKAEPEAESRQTQCL